MCRVLRNGGSRGCLVDLLIVAALLTVAVVFLKRRSIFGREDDDSLDQPLNFRTGVESGAADSGNIVNQPASVIEARIRQIGEVRSKECAALQYNLKESVSIVIDFNDYQFYSMKGTLGSVMAAAHDRVNDIVVIDDGSTLQYIIDESVKYVASLPNARLLRQPSQLGQLRSRSAGLAAARSEIVVFLDVSVICARGWLEPLVDLLGKEPNVIAVPHYDVIHDPATMEYRTTAHNLVATFTWDLNIRMRHSPDPRILPDTQYILSPALRGNAFAIRKTFLKFLGGLDVNYGDGGGEYLDLSIKTWLCGGGAVKIASCSRVGIVGLHIPVKVRTRKCIRRVVESWFGDRTDAILKFNGVRNGDGSPSPGGGDGSYPVSAAHTFPGKDKCKAFSWYLEEIKNDTRSPSADAAYFGALRAHSGRCARVGADGKIDLDHCGIEAEHAAVFELTRFRKLLTADGRCLSTATSAYVLVQKCDTQSNNTHQHWFYTDKFELVNDWSRFCVRHVTDPDKSGPKGRQIAMAQACAGEGAAASQDQFKQWTFAPPPGALEAVPVQKSNKKI